MSRATVSPERKWRQRTRLPRRISICVSILVYLLYPLAVYLAIASGRPRLALAATCLALGTLLVALPWAKRVGIAILAAVPFVLLTALSDFAQTFVFVPPIALNLGLAFLFWRSLRRGREPLISVFARAERGPLEPDIARYTRTLTGVWVAFFVASAAISALLAAIAPASVWAWFVAVGNQLMVALLFVGEYWFRRLHFPQYRHASPLKLAVIVVKQWRRPASEA